VVTEDELYERLESSLHAGEFEHIDGTLIDHLKGTYKILNSWHASESLCIAGLYHAVYSTSGFEHALVSKYNRDHIKKIIGKASEDIVYTYCAADRDFFWPQIGKIDDPLFLNRFTGDKYHLSLDELKKYCELTVANELEIAHGNPEFIQEYGASLKALFDRMKSYISNHATNHSITILGK